MFRAFVPREQKSKREQDKMIRSAESRGYEMTMNPQPREERMPVDQDWTSVWPTAQVFKPSVVPLPIRMGKPGSRANRKVPPSKYANVELLKINNFLHLTPPAIEKHCEAIKKFMTEWPNELNDASTREQHLPLEITTSDFCFSGPAVRHPDARVCTLEINISSLRLDERSRNKLILLLEHRYDAETGVITITTDRCPTRKQNRDYAVYLLTVLYHESLRVQPFESSKSELDNEKFNWDRSAAKKQLQQYLGDEDPHVAEKFEHAMQAVVDEGESVDNLEQFKEASLGVFNLKPFQFPDDDLENTSTHKNSVTN